MSSKPVKKYKHPPCEGCDKIRSWSSAWRLSRCTDCNRPGRYKTHFIAAKLSEEIIDLRREIEQIKKKYNQIVLSEIKSKLESIESEPSLLPASPDNGKAPVESSSGSALDGILDPSTSSE